jgi:formylglycine-generating enzyme required for sulfatase activity
METGSSYRVDRGGSFNDPAARARSAARDDRTPMGADNSLGLRPARAITP